MEQLTKTDIPLSTTIQRNVVYVNDHLILVAGISHVDLATQ